MYNYYYQFLNSKKTHGGANIIPFQLDQTKNIFKIPKLFRFLYLVQDTDNISLNVKENYTNKQLKPFPIGTASSFKTIQYTSNWYYKN